MQSMPVSGNLLYGAAALLGGLGHSGLQLGRIHGSITARHTLGHLLDIVNQILYRNPIVRRLF